MTTVTVPTPAAMSPEERRAFVQRSARAGYRRRVWLSRAFMSTLVLAIMVTFVPLVSILYTIVKNGWHYLSWAYLTTPQLQPSIFSHNVGGISNAITGSLLIDGIALAMAVPLSLALSIVFYEASGPFIAAFRRVVEVMVGLPSILFGLFVFIFFVTPLGYHYSGLAGSLALTLLMIPVMTIASEAALRAVPTTLTEAALALGARRSRVMFRVVLPYALPRMLTGILLSLSRAVGETAPLLLIINSSLLTNWNPWAPQSTLPLLIWNNMQAFNPTVVASSWGIALVLVIAVFVLNITSRLILARSRRG